MIGNNLVRVGAHGGVLVGIPVEGAQETVIFIGGIAAQRLRLDALGLAELLIGVIGAGGRPVVVGTEIDILRPVCQQRVIQRHRFHIGVHVADDLLLGVPLVGEHAVAVQCVRQAHTGAEGHGQHIDAGLARQIVRHSVDIIGILLGGAVHVAVHLIPGVAHPVHSLVLLLVTLQLDLLIGGRRIVVRRVGIRRIAVTAAVAVGGRRDLLLTVRRRILLVGRRILLFSQIDDDQHHSGHSHHQRNEQHQGRGAATAASVAVHFVKPSTTEAAAAASSLTHSTTSVPVCCSSAASRRASSSG